MGFEMVGKVAGKVGAPTVVSVVVVVSVAVLVLVVVMVESDPVIVVV
jgi:hypothetical protein